MTMPSLDPNAEMMTLSVREVRMIVERILLVTGLPDGFVPAVRDCILYSQGGELGGLAMLKRDLSRLKQANPAAIQISSEEGAPLAVDAARQHAWIVAPGLLDIVLADFRNGGPGKIAVRNVIEAPELELLRGYAGRYGAAVDIAIGNGQATVQVTADRLTTGDATLERILARGMPVTRALWSELYAQSHHALTPDSIVSRRHAGPVMVDAEGRVHGRDDDDTDFALLGVNQAGSAAENA